MTWTPMRTLPAIHRKLLRDVWHMRGQVLSIAALVMCGVGTVVAMHGTLRSVEHERDDYYRRSRFGDVFASGTRIPEPVAEKLAAIPGVAVVSPRASMRVSLDVAGLGMPAGGRVMAVPDGAEPALNVVHISAGRMVHPHTTNEAVVSEGFARANKIAVGDSIGAVMEGRWRRLHVVGIGMSPEYLWELAGADFFTADERAFGLLWMSQNAVEAAAGMEGAFNDVSVRLVPGAREASVRAEIDTLLARYGGVGAVGRDRQPSNYIIASEIRQLRTFGNTLPTIFLIVATFLLNVVLARLVATQRPELAALKAFGYTNREVRIHYLGFAVLAVVIGAVLGIGLGVWIGGRYTAIYARYFRFPDLSFSLDAASTLFAIGASAAAGVAGALFAVRSAVRLPPAEALRPESPERYRPLLLERLNMAAWLSPAARMVLRTIERRPFRTASGMLGVGLAMGLLAGTLSLFDAAWYMVDVIFRLAQREDVSVSFNHPVSATGATASLQRIPGVMIAEAYRVVPARVRNEGVVRTIAVTALASDASLRRMVDEHGESHTIPPGGAVVSAGLADLLRLERGDSLRLELIERGGEMRTVVVSGVVPELVGANVYMQRRALDALIGEDGEASGVHMRVDARALPAVLAELKVVPAIAGASSRQALIDAFDRQMIENIRISGTVVVTFAIIIALGVVYNGARVALSERGRELASLRVLGFTRREVSTLLFAEQAVIIVAALPLGMVFGIALTRLIVTAFQAEDHRFPMVVDASTYVGAVGIVILAGVLAGLLMQRRLNRMDLIAVLKTRE
ncbi:MAG TPA: ABC transporter permease [Gemmatimonadaceae bacterium]|nr:ABC transporter permease [Gemmatimonadaceae bacterium]